MTLFITTKRLALVASVAFALLAVVSCGQAQPVATVAPTPAIVVPVATEAGALRAQAIQEMAAPEAAPAVEVDQPAASSNESAPCAAGQLKGNETSHIFHAPGQIAYAKTHAHVTCFDTAAQATAAGYRAAKR